MSTKNLPRAVDVVALMGLPFDRNTGDAMFLDPCPLPWETSYEDGIIDSQVEVYLGDNLAMEITDVGTFEVGTGRVLRRSGYAYEIFSEGAERECLAYGWLASNDAPQQLEGVIREEAKDHS